MTEVSKRSAIEHAQEALEPGERIERVFLAEAAADRDALKDARKRQRDGEPVGELPLGARYARFAVMATDRNLYVFPQATRMRRGELGAATVAVTGLVPLDVSAGEKHPLGSIPVDRQGKPLQVGDLKLKIVWINRKDAEALVSFVKERSQPVG